MTIWPLNYNFISYSHNNTINRWNSIWVVPLESRDGQCGVQACVVLHIVHCFSLFLPFNKHFMKTTFTENCSFRSIFFMMPIFTFDSNSISFFKFYMCFVQIFFFIGNVVKNSHNIKGDSYSRMVTAGKKSIWNKKWWWCRFTVNSFDSQCKVWSMPRNRNRTKSTVN